MKNQALGFNCNVTLLMFLTEIINRSFINRQQKQYMYTGAEQSWVITCCYGGSRVDVSNNKSKSRKITNIKLFRFLVFSCVDVLYGSFKYYNLTKQNLLVKKVNLFLLLKKVLC